MIETKYRLEVIVNTGYIEQLFETVQDALLRLEEIKDIFGEENIKDFFLEMVLDSKSYLTH